MLGDVKRSGAPLSKGKFGLGAIVFLVVLSLTTRPVPAALTGAHVEETNCQGISAVVPIPLENVDPVVPNEFTIFTDKDTGLAQLDIGAVRCDELRIYDEEGNLESALRDHLHFTFRVQLCDPQDPPEIRCQEERGELPPELDGAHVEAFHGYTFWIATNNRDLVRFYRDYGGVTDHQAVYADDLVLELVNPTQDLDPANDLAPAMITVVAPSAPSSFKMTAKAGSLVGPLNISGGFWTAVPKGTMVQQPDRLDLFRLGTVSEGELTPTKKGSEMDRLLCDSRIVNGEDVGGRSSGEPVELSTDDSLRIAFASGEFTVRTDASLKTSETDRATCDAW